MKGIAYGIANREKDEGRDEDAHIIIAEAYERILQHYNSSAKFHWCGIDLVFFGDQGPNQYSPDRPDPPQMYSDGSVASCLACNRLFNDLSENGRSQFMNVLIAEYEPSRHEVAPHELTVSEMRCISGNIWQHQVERKKQLGRASIICA